MSNSPIPKPPPRTQFPASCKPHSHHVALTQMVPPQGGQTLSLPPLSPPTPYPRPYCLLQDFHRTACHLKSSYLLPREDKGLPRLLTHRHRILGSPQLLTSPSMLLIRTSSLRISKAPWIRSSRFMPFSLARVSSNPFSASSNVC